MSNATLADTRNWREDFAHVNGYAECKCVYCNLTFMGHKLRVCCRSCYFRGGESEG